MSCQPGAEASTPLSPAHPAVVDIRNRKEFACCYLRERIKALHHHRCCSPTSSSTERATGHECQPLSTPVLWVLPHQQHTRQTCIPRLVRAPPSLPWTARMCFAFGETERTPSIRPSTIKPLCNRHGRTREQAYLKANRQDSSLRHSKGRGFADDRLHPSELEAGNPPHHAPRYQPRLTK